MKKLRFIYIFFLIILVISLQNRFVSAQAQSVDRGTFTEIGQNSLFRLRSSTTEILKNQSDGALFPQSPAILPFGLAGKLRAGNVSVLDDFGFSSAIDGDTAIIGDSGADVNGSTAQGAAHIFVRNNGLWQLQQSLTTTVASPGKNFGFRVDIEGDTAVVSSSLNLVTSTDVWIFVRNGTTWTLQAYLTGSPTENFVGAETSLSGNTLAVGSNGNGVVNNTGVVYVFIRSGSSWNFQAKLFASDGSQMDNFGVNSVAVSGDTIIAGASGDDITFPNENQGSAYIFTRSGAVWTQTQKLTVPNSFNFGSSCAIEGETALVGMGRFLQGKAFVYAKNAGTWNLQAELQAADTIFVNFFGLRVSLSGNVAVVGAHKSSFTVDASEGAAYIFTRSGTTWTQTANLYAPDRMKHDNFGRSVAVSGTTVIVGANKDNFFSNTAPGTAYVFSDVSASSPDLQTSSDHGTSENDNITNTNQLLIDVNNATVGATIELLRNNAVVSSVTATSNSVTFTDIVPTDGQFQYNSREIFQDMVSLPSAALFVTIDTIAPTVTINQTIGQNDPTSQGAAAFIINTSDDMPSFNANWVSLAQSTANLSQATTQISGGGQSFGFSINNIVSNGQFVRAAVPGGSFTDVAGNFNLPSTSTDNTVTVDNVLPTVTINQGSMQSDPTRNLPLVFDVVFSEPVTSFFSNDINLSGSTASTIGAVVNVTGSGALYTVSISGIMSNGGYVQATIPQFAANDSIGNSNLPSTSADNQITFDNVPPTVTINQAPGQADPASAQPINFRVVFSESVTGFNEADVSLSSSTANVSVAVVAVTGSGAIYNVAINNITSSGIVRASVLANAAQDTLGNFSLASTSTDSSVTFNLKRSFFDFDGDSRADISVYRPSNGNWYLLNSQAGFSATQFGISTDKLAPADFDGDGKTDLAVYRNGTWFLLQSTNGFVAVQFGIAEDVPTPADFDGDGKADIAVFRPSNGVWYRFNSSNGQFVATQFGISEDKPTLGDFDGDNKADIAVFRPSSGFWYRLNSGNGQFLGVQFGIAEDKPGAADYDGDGKTDIAVYRPSGGFWYRINSTNSQFISVQFGLSDDAPTPADYDGDGRADISVFRPSSGIWYRLNSTNSQFLGVQFGIAEDKPIPASFVR